MKILIDHRELSSGIKTSFEKYTDVVCEVRRLGCGDYETDTGILFERKTFPDFICSLKDGRLFSQAFRLYKTGKRCVYILEGVSAGLPDSKMQREAMQGAIIYLTVFMGFSLLRSMNADETAKLIVMTTRKSVNIQPSLKKPFQIYRNGDKSTHRQRMKVQFLQGLPGIGAKKAKNLLEKFGSIKEILLADNAQLESVHGIGRKISAKIKNTVEESYR